MTNNPREERMCLLGDVLPLQVNLRLTLINLQCVPGAFVLILLLFIMRVDVLINDRQLLLRGSGDFVSEYGLLKCNEWKIGVVDWGEKAVVFVESGFVTTNIKLPCRLYLLLKRGAFLAEQVRIRLCVCEGNNFSVMSDREDGRSGRFGGLTHWGQGVDYPVGPC